ETINRQGLETEVVLLSGYRDFEYARAALRYGVHCYLLKPTKEDELRTVFADLRDKIAAHRATAAPGTMRRLVSEGRQRLLARLVNGLVDGVGELVEQWRHCGLPLLSGDVAASYALMRISGQGGAPHSDDAPAAMLRDRAHRLCLDEPGLVTVVLVEPPDLLHFLAIARSADDRRPDPACVCRETVVSRIEGASRTMCDPITSRAIERVEDLLALSTLDLDGASVTTVRDPDVIAGEVLDAAFDRADSGEAAVRREVARAGTRLRSTRRAAIAVVSAVAALSRRRSPRRDLGPEVNYEALFRCSTVDEAVSWAGCETRRILAAFRESTAGSHADVVARVHSYIGRHLAEDIGLEQVAREVYLSPAYLSRLFHRQSGQSFVDAVTGARVERARALLADRPVMSIAAVSRAVGYADPKYFTRVFKSRTGRTPTEYRRELALS
ncbi:MAG: helix-turn-helix domain-containing protein, partial [bacterium]